MSQHSWLGRLDLRPDWTGGFTKSYRQPLRFKVVAGTTATRDTIFNAQLISDSLQSLQRTLFPKMSPLAAFNPPLGPLVSQCHPDAVTLHMKEKAFSLTGDDFTVKTVAGVEVCKCKGKGVVSQ